MSKKNIYFYISIVCFAFISNCFATSDLPYKEGELLVRFAPKADGSQKTVQEHNQILSSLNAGEAKRSYKRVSGLTLVKLPDNLKVEDALPTLKGKGEILYVEPNYKIKLLSTIPNDTRFYELWGMRNTGQNGGTSGADIDATLAWDLATSSSVIVAVTDTGIDRTHPDLAANMWVNEAELNGATGVDDDGNGKVDDIYGWDFADNDNNPTDYAGHGTHVAGIIGARGNNGVGVTGVCWNVKIMNLKVFPNYGEEGFISDAIDAIDYTVDKSAKVINASWGGGGSSQSLKDAIDDANVAGVLFIAAAGNNGTDNDGSSPAYPASYDCSNIIAVMATNNSDEVAYYSNYGQTKVDLAAPGGEMNYEGDPGGILSTLPGNTYEFYQGTSMAAPHVAGACALIWGAHPNLTHLQVKDAIMQSVDHLASLNGKCVTGGRLNLYKAVNHWPLHLTKTDNVEDGQGVIPYNPCLNNLLEYSIRYDACGISDTNVVLADQLPNDVNYHDSIPQGNYDANTHTVTWQIGTIEPNDSNCFVLRTEVKEGVMSGKTIINTCELSGDNFTRQASESTFVGCYEGEIIFVDADANDGGDGRSWATAFNDLQLALETIRTRNSPCDKQIWVSAGIYKRTNDANLSDANFVMIDGVDMCGHFAGWEDSIDQRSLADANYETILDGNDNIFTVMTADACIDGFTVQGAYYGILCSGCSPTIVNCIIQNNIYDGIYGESGAQVKIINSFINNNNSTGIYSRDSGTSIDIKKCTVGPNNSIGLLLSYSTLNAIDSLFSGNFNYGIYAWHCPNLIVEKCDISDTDNGSGFTCGYCTNANIQKCTIQRNSGNIASGLHIGTDSNVKAVSNIISDNGIYGYGVYITSDSGNNQLTGNLIYGNGEGYGVFSKRAVELLNNTIAYNYYGLYYPGDSNVSCNLIWGNGSNYFGAFDSNKVNYNCIQGGFDGGTGNIDVDPCFMDANNCNFHLKGTSDCIDKGDPNFSSSTEQDIDGEMRVMQGRVDMGADEFCPYDLSQDGFVNFFDFAVFAGSWGKSAGDANYNDLCDFYNDGKIDYKDLSIFCVYWLSPSDWEPIGGEGAYFAENSSSGEGGEMMAMQQPEQEADEMMMELPEDEQQSMMAGEGETAAVYLISDVNEPNSGDEVTVQIYTDTPLFCMGLIITVTGDATITDAVSTADCNEYGWDPDWPTDPYIDPEGWLYVSGVSWEGQAEGVVGYLKFLYNSGEVNVSITEGDAFDAYCEPALISGEILTFGADPNES